LKKAFFRKKLFWIPLVSIVGLLLVVYFGGGYIVYDKLSSIGPPDVEMMANNPSSFKGTDEENKTFDTKPYEVSSYETVAFPSRQTEIILRGWYLEVDRNAPAVVITHGLRSAKNDAILLTAAGMLAHNGFNVLLYDIRNHGESDKDNGRVAAGNKEYKDVLGAWDYLVKVKGFSPERVGLYAISLGAGTSLMAFGQEPRAAALFVDSPFFNLPEIIKAELARNNYPTLLWTPTTLMARLTGENLLAQDPADAINNDNGRPIYVVHGTADTRVSINQTYELESLARAKGANVTVWITDSTHVYSIFTHTSEYEQRLVGFFETNLK